MTMCCPVTGLKIPQLLMAALGGFIFIFGFDYLVHHILLMEQYEATSALWRSMADMENFFHWMLISQFATVFVLAVLYGKFVVCRQMKMSLWFGVLVGLALGISAFKSYAYMPISIDLALAWLGAETLKGIGLALIFMVAFSCCKKSSCDTGEGACNKDNGSCGADKPDAEGS